jgi:predicted TIM-barrel fold metal-dependent hydrolase/pimeloyl-ACP methyl ester carboxylesterase
MRTIILDSNAFAGSKESRKFVLLGSKTITSANYVEKMIQPKIDSQSKETVPGFWGTLGYHNDKEIDWTGHIEISAEGNDSFRGVVKDEVKLIKNCYPQLKTSLSNIRERFISFEHLDFNFPDIFSLEQIPRLRLNIMLESDEGAIVFYQSDKDNKRDNSIEYIQPEATDGNTVSDRDRLKYFFDVIPQYQMEDMEGMPGYFKLNTTKEPKPFIIKIITFRRDFDKRGPTERTRKTSVDVIAQVELELNRKWLRRKVAKPHELLIFNKSRNKFLKAKKNSISPDEKTLFLMHGTFSDTKGSFKDLYKRKGTWLAEMISGKNEVYEQIIAFDHPTVLYGAVENINALFEQLDELNFDSFEKDVDFIGTSQGGLLVQHLANTANSRIKVGKAALVASANGVGYFTAGRYVSKFLSAMKLLFKFTGVKRAELISGLAQHSADLLLGLPGFQIMTPGNKHLTMIINKLPVSENTLYLPVIDDFDKSIVEGEKNRFIRFIKRMGSQMIDKVATTVLGEDNDWVVGTKNQYLVPRDYCIIPDYHPGKYRNEMETAIHGKCLRLSDVQKELGDFFSGNYQYDTPRKRSADHFDGHLHIFGREVISGRLVLMLMQELLSYLKAESRTDELKFQLDKADLCHEEHEQTEGSLISNFVKYFLLNETSFQMLDDLEREYLDLNSNIYRYIPLMFDPEMSFRNKYYESDSESNLIKAEDEYKKLYREFMRDVNSLIKRFEKMKELVFGGSHIENEARIKALKVFKSSVKALQVMKKDFKKDTVDCYQKQLDDMKTLKDRYGDSIFPFLAVDPRRDKMAQIILKQVGEGRPFKGIKLYAPNGYSPTDPRLFDDDSEFINGKSLYSYCIDQKIPIMAHCSSAGYATFAKELELCGDVRIDGKIKSFSKPTEICFDSSFLIEGFKDSVRERASVLNHPMLWEIVLEKYKDLQICLAHFGGESKEWQGKIAALVKDYDNVYTDLSCKIHREDLEQIKADYFDTEDEITDRILYGSDYFMNMLQKISFENYYKQFEDVFTIEQLNKMTLTVPKKFLGIV